MLTKAVARYIRVSPTKARLIADLLRGKTVGEALSILQYSPQAAARLVEKVLRSAVANAEHNHEVRSFEDLRVGALIDGGPVLKRIQPRAMGRAFHIRHRTSHITITLTEPTRAEVRAHAAPTGAAQRPASRTPAKAGGPAGGATATARKPPTKPQAKGRSTRSA